MVLNVPVQLADRDNPMIVADVELCFVKIVSRKIINLIEFENKENFE